MKHFYIECNTLTRQYNAHRKNLDQIMRKHSKTLIDPSEKVDNMRVNALKSKLTSKKHIEKGNDII